MKALVTGATGFVGSHLVEALQRRRHRGDRAGPLAAKGGGRWPSMAYGWSAETCTIPPALDARRAPARMSIYHVAGVVAARDEAEFLRANRDGTRNILTAAERQGRPRFVLVSSLAAAGPAPPRRAAVRTELPAPGHGVWPEQAGGRARLCGAAALPWSIVRPPIVYGPRDREVLKVFRLARLGVAPVFGDGSQELSAVHAADLAQALVAVGESPGRPSAGPTTPVTLRCSPARSSGRRWPQRWGARSRVSVFHRRWDGRCSPSPKPRPGSPGRPRSSRPTRRTSSSSRPGPATPLR